MPSPYRFIVAALILTLAGCAGHAPVPGGSESANVTYYRSPDDLVARLGQIRTGMPETEVFARLGRTPKELTWLRRDEVLTALMGTNNVEFRHGFEEKDLIQSVYGYRLEYKSIKKKLGFSSPIRITTDRKGFNFTVTLVFKDGVLFTDPVLSGGIVNTSSSDTIFDFLNPGTVLDHASH